MKNPEVFQVSGPTCTWSTGFLVGCELAWRKSGSHKHSYVQTHRSMIILNTHSNWPKMQFLSVRRWPHRAGADVALIPHGFPPPAGSLEVSQDCLCHCLCKGGCYRTCKVQFLLKHCPVYTWPFSMILENYSNNTEHAFCFLKKYSLIMSLHLSRTKLWVCKVTYLFRREHCATVPE